MKAAVMGCKPLIEDLNSDYLLLIESNIQYESEIDCIEESTKNFRGSQGTNEATTKFGNFVCIPKSTRSAMWLRVIERYPVTADMSRARDMNRLATGS